MLREKAPQLPRTPNTTPHHRNATTKPDECHLYSCILASDLPKTKMKISFPLDVRFHYFLILSHSAVGISFSIHLLTNTMKSKNKRRAHTHKITVLSYLLINKSVCSILNGIAAFPYANSVVRVCPLRAINGVWCKL